MLALVLKFRLGLLANPQNFYPVEGTDLLFLNEEAAASWLEASPSQGCIANELYELKILHRLQRYSVDALDSIVHAMCECMS